VAIPLPRVAATAVADSAEKSGQFLIEKRLDGRANRPRSRSSIGSLPASPSSSAGMAVAVLMVMA